MSGFFGMLRLDGEPICESLLKEIAEELRFRGPDGVNVCFDGAIGGCFARMRRAEEFDEYRRSYNGFRCAGLFLIKIQRRPANCAN